MTQRSKAIDAAIFYFDKLQTLKIGKIRHFSKNYIKNSLLVAFLRVLNVRFSSFVDLGSIFFSSRIWNNLKLQKSDSQNPIFTAFQPFSTLQFIRFGTKNVLKMPRYKLTKSSLHSPSKASGKLGIFLCSDFWPKKSFPNFFNFCPPITRTNLNCVIRTSA